MCIVGIIIVIIICWLISENKRKFPFRIVLWGLGLQIVLAALLLYVPFTSNLMKSFSVGVTQFLGFARNGAEFAFGKLSATENVPTLGYQFAIMIASTVIFFSALVSLFYHWGIIQKVVYGIAWVMHKTLKTSGSESLSAAADIFLGQVEAPLLVRHYLPDATRSEINSIMVCGYATIAGSVFASFVMMGIDAQYLIIASVLSTIGGLVLSKVVIPETGQIQTLSEIKEINVPKSENFLLAISGGAADGMSLSINIIAMVIAFIAIIALLDAGFSVTSGWLSSIGFHYFPSSIKQLLGYVFLPFGYLVGLTGNDAQIFGSVFGTKIAFNEFVAYIDLAKMIETAKLSARPVALATFALCGFANFGSIAIQIGGLGALVPNRKALFAKLAFRAMIIGALANLLTTSIAGLFI
ncbi:MAG: nucleoside transporter C-terminal domain-containing protein [bacterium]